MGSKKTEYKTVEEEKGRGRLPARILLQIKDGENYNTLAEGEVGYLIDSEQKDENGVKSYLISVASRARLLTIALYEDFQELESREELDYARELLEYLATAIERGDEVYKLSWPERKEKTVELLGKWGIDPESVSADRWGRVGYFSTHSYGSEWHQWPDGFPVDEMYKIRGGYK